MAVRPQRTPPIRKEDDGSDATVDTAKDILARSKQINERLEALMGLNRRLAVARRELDKDAVADPESVRSKITAELSRIEESIRGGDAAEGEARLNAYEAAQRWRGPLLVRIGTINERMKSGGREEQLTFQSVVGKFLADDYVGADEALRPLESFTTPLPERKVMAREVAGPAPAGGTKCVLCGHDVAANVSTCPFCGHDPSAPSRPCSHCGRTILQAFSNCPFCGKVACDG